MNYEEFKNALLTEITKKLGSTGEAHLGMDTIMGTPTETIRISLSSKKAAIAVGLLPLYSLHKKSSLDMEHIASIVLESMEITHAKPIFDPSTVIYRLVNIEANKKMLQDVPYIQFYDMAITFASIVSENDQTRECLVITNQVMKEQNLTLAQLTDLAHKNTFRMYPSIAEILPMYLFRRVMQNDQATVKDYVEVALAAYASKEKPPMLRVSSSDYRYGGVALLDNKHFEEIAKVYKRNLLVLPSSEQDFVVMPWEDGLNVKELLKLSNEIVNEGDAPILTRNVFCYNMLTKKLELLEM